MRSGDDDYDVDSTWMKGTVDQIASHPASIASVSRPAYSRTEVLAESAKKCADGGGLITDASIVVHTDNDA